MWDPSEYTIDGGNLRSGEMLNEQVSNMSKRAGNIDKEQVSATSDPVRGLCPEKKMDQK